jgi:DNA-binding IclR family transcriptional regulator
MTRDAAGDEFDRVRSPRQRSSLDKAIEVLEAFEGGGSSRSLMQIVEQTGLPKSTVHRLLATLISHGFVDRAGARYVLGSRLFVLGNHVPFCRPRQVREVAKPFLCDLQGHIRQNIHLAMLESDSVLYVEKLSLGRSPLPTSVGAMLPAHHTALGKALLAYSSESEIDAYLRRPLAKPTNWTVTDPAAIKRELRDVRLNGYATEHNETMIGLSCVAAPIFSRRSRQPVAALSVSVLGEGSPLDYLVGAREVARRIGADLQTGTAA